MRTVLVLAILLLSAASIAACSNDGERPAAEPPAAPPSKAPALPPGVPPGLDPNVVRAYEEAPVPPPVPFAASKQRIDAGKSGAFEGLPAEGAVNLGELLGAFAAAKAAAEAHPGRMGGGAAGPSLEPSREELRFAELTERLRASLAEAGPAKAAAAWRAAGLSDKPLIGFTLVVTTAKVFGTGYVETVDGRPVELAPPK